MFEDAVVMNLIYEFTYVLFGFFYYWMHTLMELILLFVMHWWAPDSTR